MKSIYYFKKDVRVVTGYYYGIIIEGLKQNGFSVYEIDSHNSPTWKFPVSGWNRFLFHHSSLTLN